MVKAPVNKIIPLSVVDGPGNRSAVFVQGCNIACAYCHNPETQNLCCSCGACVAECPAGALSMKDGRVCWDQALCVACDHCIAVCGKSASPKVVELTAAEVFQRIEKNIPFIRGITVSGGECSLYTEFLTELFRLARRAGLTCLMDSNGTVDLSGCPELLAVCDGVMLDVKSWDPEVYRRLTGGDNAVVLRNLSLLAGLKKITEVRIVCLPGESDPEAVIDGISEQMSGRPDFRLKLIRFRPFGVKGRLEHADMPGDEYMEGLNQKALSCGFRDVVIT